MGKPSIGDAVIVSTERENKRKVQELTILDENSKESIFNLIFSSMEKGGTTTDEQRNNQ